MSIRNVISNEASPFHAGELELQTHTGKREAIASFSRRAIRAFMLEARRLATMARSFGLEMNIISPAEAKDLFPYIETAGLEGAAFIPSDGHVPNS